MEKINNNELLECVGGSLFGFCANLLISVINFAGALRSLWRR